jgi:hypothetical protein
LDLSLDKIKRFFQSIHQLTLIEIFAHGCLNQKNLNLANSMKTKNNPHASHCFANGLLALVLLSTFALACEAVAAVDERFGVTAQHGDGGLGARELGMSWYRDYNASYNFLPPSGMKKMWTVGKLDARKDLEALGLARIETAGVFGNFGLAWPFLNFASLDPAQLETTGEVGTFMSLLGQINFGGLVGIVWNDNKADLEAVVRQKVVAAANGASEYGLNLSVTTLNLPASLGITSPLLKKTVTGLQLTSSATGSTRWRLDGSSPKSRAEGTTNVTISFAIDLEKDDVGPFFIIKAVPNVNTTVTRAWVDVVIDLPWPLSDYTVNIPITSLVQTACSLSLDPALKNELLQELRVADFDVDGQPDLDRRYYLRDYFGGGVVPNQDEVLRRIFEAEKPLVRDVINRGFVGQYWEVANEPNIFPYITPEKYAAYYEKFYRYIKSIDPTAKILNGGLFTSELIQGPDSLFLNLIEKNYGFSFSGYGFESVILGIVTKYGTLEWYSRFIASLPSDVSVDVANIHLYPAAPVFNPIGTVMNEIDWPLIKMNIDFTARSIQEWGRAREVWVTEVGNIDDQRSEAFAAELTGFLSDYLVRNGAGITKWFWFRSAPEFNYYGFAPSTELFERIPGSPIVDWLILTALPKSEFKKYFRLSPVGKAYSKYYVSALCDVDKSYVVDINDMNFILQQVRLKSTNLAYDLNNDGIVSIADSRFVAANFTYPGGSPWRPR